MLRLVLVHPEIPGNTGAAIRIAACTGAELHLVRPLGFDLSDAKLRRAGLDYHDLAEVKIHDDLAGLWAALADEDAPPPRVLAFTARASTRHTDLEHHPHDVLVFGGESAGLPDEVLHDPHVAHWLRIPMVSGRRSMNLSNAAAVAVHEAWRQLGFPGADA